MYRKGDVIFFKVEEGHFTEEAVAFFSHSKDGIFHVALVVEDTETIEANFGKLVGYANIGDYTCPHVVKSYKGITDEQRQGIIDYCIAHFGEKYDVPEIGKLFFEFFHITVPYHETHCKICSTLVYQAYKSQGLIVAETEDCTPGQVYDYPVWE